MEDVSNDLIGSNGSNVLMDRHDYFHSNGGGLPGGTETGPISKDYQPIKRKELQLHSMQLMNHETGCDEALRDDILDALDIVPDSIVATSPAPELDLPAEESSGPQLDNTLQDWDSITGSAAATSALGMDIIHPRMNVLPKQEIPRPEAPTLPNRSSSSDILWGGLGCAETGSLSLGNMRESGFSSLSSMVESDVKRMFQKRLVEEETEKIMDPHSSTSEPDSDHSSRLDEERHPKSRLTSDERNGLPSASRCKSKPSITTEALPKQPMSCADPIAKSFRATPGNSCPPSRGSNGRGSGKSPAQANPDQHEPSMRSRPRRTIVPPAKDYSALMRSSFPTMTNAATASQRKCDAYVRRSIRKRDKPQRFGDEESPSKDEGYERPAKKAKQTGLEPQATAKAKLKSMRGKGKLSMDPKSQQSAPAGNAALQAAGKGPDKGPNVTLTMLVKAGLIRPGKHVLCVVYNNSFFKADLMRRSPINPTRIRFKDHVFNTPSEFSIYVKRLVNPVRKKDNGWASVMFKGRPLKTFRATFLASVEAGVASAVAIAAEPEPPGGKSGATGGRGGQSTTASSGGHSGGKTTRRRAQRPKSASVTASGGSENDRSSKAASEQPGSSAYDPMSSPTCLWRWVSPFWRPSVWRRTACTVKDKAKGRHSRKKRERRYKLSLCPSERMSFLPVRNSQGATRSAYARGRLRGAVQRRQSSLRYSQFVQKFQAGHADPLTMVSCEHCSVDGRHAQPFSVHVSPEASFLCDFHAHLSDAEIIGLLGGRWDAQTKRVVIELAFPCRALDNADDAHTNVEMDPASELQIREVAKQRGLQVVGWYHSHPTFQTDPSVRDIENQASYQSLFKQAVATPRRRPGNFCQPPKMMSSTQTVAPFVGLIVGPYDANLPAFNSWMQYFFVLDTKAGCGMPMHCVSQFTHYNELDPQADAPDGATSASAGADPDDVPPPLSSAATRNVEAAMLGGDDSPLGARMGMGGLGGSGSSMKHRQAEAEAEAEADMDSDDDAVAGGGNTNFSGKIDIAQMREGIWPYDKWRDFSISCTTFNEAHTPAELLMALTQLRRILAAEKHNGLNWKMCLRDIMVIARRTRQHSQELWTDDVALAYQDLLKDMRVEDNFNLRVKALVTAQSMIESYGSHMEGVCAQVIDIVNYYCEQSNRTNFEEEWKQMKKFDKIRESIAPWIGMLPMPVERRDPFLNDCMSYLRLVWKAHALEKRKAKRGGKH